MASSTVSYQTRTVHFDIAPAASQRYPTLDHECARCGTRCMFDSQLAYTCEVNGPFGPSDDSTVTRAVDITMEDGTFQN